MKILVTGATGSQAKPVVLQLLEKGHEVLAFTRDKAKADDLVNAGAMIFEGDLLDKEDVLRAIEQVDSIALHIPFFMPTPHIVGENIIQAAKKVGIQYIVWNTAGAIFSTTTGNPAYDVRVDIQKLLGGSGIKHTILQPTVYAENLLGPWTAPSVKKENKVAYPVPIDFKIGWLPSSDMAKAMVAALENTDLAGNNLIISGKSTMNGTDLEEAFSEGLGREIKYYPMPPKDFGKILNSIMGEGTGDAVAAEYQAIWDGHIQPKMYSDMKETLSKLNIEFTDLKDWVAQFSFIFG
ncbi:MAG: NmrA family NAD(P)-binding protein [Bacteroidota bacterium]